MIPKRRAHLSRGASLFCSYPYGAWAVSRPPTRTLSPSLFLQAVCFQPSKYSRVRHRAPSSVPELLGVPWRLKTSWTPRSVNSAAAFLFALETAARSGRRSTHVLRAPARHLCGSHRDAGGLGRGGGICRLVRSQADSATTAVPTTVSLAPTHVTCKRERKSTRLVCSHGCVSSLVF